VGSGKVLWPLVLVLGRFFGLWCWFWEGSEGPLGAGPDGDSGLSYISPSRFSPKSPTGPSNFYTKNLIIFQFHAVKARGHPHTAADGEEYFPPIKRRSCTPYVTPQSSQTKHCVRDVEVTGSNPVGVTTFATRLEHHVRDVGVCLQATKHRAFIRGGAPPPGRVSLR